MNAGKRRFSGAARAATICGWLVSGALGQDIGPAAQQQIADILAVKRGMNANQQKLDSALMFSLMAAQTPAAVSTFSDAVPSLATDPDGNVTVDIHGNATPALTAAIAAAGGQILSPSAQFGIIRASVPKGALENLAASSDIKSIQADPGYRTNGPAGLFRRTQKRPANLSSRFVPNFIGSLTSQGYITHGANVEVANGISGAGITVGVLSDSALPAEVSALISTGDLPSTVQVLPGQAGPTGGTNEGTAMMEIVYDMAPGTNLIFATADNGIASFAANIIALQQAGCKVIVDDVTYLNEGAFQDGPIAQAVNQVVAAGVTYFSSAANSGNLDSGTSGTWEGDFVSGGPVGGIVAAIGETGLVHSFGSQTYDSLTGTSSFISLKWSDPLGGSNNDYDLFILDSTGGIVKGFSAAAQTGTQDPFEFVSQGTNCGTITASGYCSTVGDRVVLVLYSGAARALRVDTNRGQLAIATAGSTFGHNAGVNTVTMAATYWNSSRTGTRPFTGFANPIETFSSDGPRKIFYSPNGTPITPGNFLFGTNGGTTLQKPDLTAADGNSARTPGFSPFFGTSAAAPHAAGIAALVLQAKPSYTPAQVKNAMTIGALDTMAPGVDRDSGYGIVMATLAVQYALTH